MTLPAPAPADHQLLETIAERVRRLAVRVVQLVRWAMVNAPIGTLALGGGRLQGRRVAAAPGGA